MRLSIAVRAKNRLCSLGNPIHFSSFSTSAPNTRFCVCSRANNYTPHPKKKNNSKKSTRFGKPKPSQDVWWLGLCLLQYRLLQSPPVDTAILWPLFRTHALRSMWWLFHLRRLLRWLLRVLGDLWPGVATELGGESGIQLSWSRPWELLAVSHETNIIQSQSSPCRNNNLKRSPG